MEFGFQPAILHSRDTACFTLHSNQFWEIKTVSHKIVRSCLRDSLFCPFQRQGCQPAVCMGNFQKALKKKKKTLKLKAIFGRDSGKRKKKLFKAVGKKY